MDYEVGYYLVETFDDSKTLVNCRQFFAEEFALEFYRQQKTVWKHVVMKQVRYLSAIE